MKSGEDDGQVYHLRFPENRLDYSVQREGNAPADIDRHPWERRLRLEIDLPPITSEVRKRVLALLGLPKDDRMTPLQKKAVREELLCFLGAHVRNIMGAEFRGRPLTAKEIQDFDNYERAAQLKFWKDKTRLVAGQSRHFRKIPGSMHHDRIKYSG